MAFQNLSVSLQWSRQDHEFYNKYVVAIFYGYKWRNISLRYRAIKPHGLLHLLYNLVLADRGAIAFFIYSNFINMPRPMKSRVKLKNSTLKSAACSRRTVSYRDFKTEMDCKNKAYSFILSHNLLEDFTKFCKTYHSDDPHKDCLDFLSSNI